MHIAKLWIQGFRSFTERQEIRFNGPGTVTAVTGWNAASGSGSGSGKSSIFGALAYLLGYPEFAATTQHTYLSNIPMDVEGSFEHDGQEIRIRRGKQTYVEVAGERVAINAAAVTAWIKDFFKLQNIDIMSTLTYRPQRCQGLFLSLTDGEKKEFISEVLGLQKYEDMASKAGQEANALRSKAVGLEEALNSVPAVEEPDELDLPLPPAQPSYEDMLSTGDTLRLNGNDVEELVKEGLVAIGKAFEPRLARLTADCDAAGVSRGDVAEKLNILKEAMAERRAASQDAIAAASKLARENAEGLVEDDLLALKSAHAKAGKPLAAAAEKLEVLTALVAKNWAAAQVAAQDIAKRQVLLGHAKSQISQSQLRCEALRQQLCDVCNQPLPDNSLLKAEEAKLAKLIGDEGRMAAGLMQAEADQSQLEASLAADGVEQVALKAECDTLRSEVQRLLLEIKNKQQQMARDVQTAVAMVEVEERKKLEAEIASLQVMNDGLMQALTAADTERHALVSARAATAERKHKAVADLKEWGANAMRLQAEYQASCQRIQDAYVTAQKHAQESNARRAKILLDVAAARGEAFSYADLQVVAKAFLGAISEEVLAETSEETNAALAELPNTRGYTLSFVGEHLTQKGTLKQEIKAVVRNAFSDGVDLKAQFSGGQLTSAELAVDLAWAVVLRRRRGSTPTPAWFILDEAFDGHDTRVKEACVEILHRIAIQANMQVLVVDHASEFRASVENRIHVTYTADGSQIVPT